MSGDATGWAYRHSPYRGATLAVHLAVADSVNDQFGNEFWMTQSSLALKARVSRESVNIALAQLVADGFLELLEVGGGRAKYAKYRFLFNDRAVVYDGRSPRKLSAHPTVKRETVGSPDSFGSTKLSETAPETVGSAGHIKITQEKKEPKRAKEPLAEAEPQPPKGMRGSKLRLTEDWTPDAKDLAWAKAKYPTIDLDEESEKFRNHWVANAETSARWDLRWRNWVINASKWARPGRRAAPARSGQRSLAEMWAADTGTEGGR